MDADRFDALVATFVTAPSRRAALRALGGLGLAGLFSQADAKKHKKHKKKCAKSGQPTSKKRKKCCKGLVKDATGRCVRRCTPATCAPTACGSVPDRCGGTLNCGGCAGERICVSEVCQECTVICTASPAECGTVLGAAMSAGGTVYVCPGRYQAQGTFGFAVVGTLRLIGAGADDDPTSNTILDAAGAGRVFTVNSGALVDLERLRFTGGTAIIAGGGILLNAQNAQGTTLRMTECTVSGNIVTAGNPSARGGGIAALGSATLEMTRCTFSDNHVAGNPALGGGISTTVATTLTDCLVEDNSADAFGGGLYVAGGTTTLAGTTQVRGNAAAFGGGIFVDAGALIAAESCQVTENTAAAPANGGGIYNDGGTVTLQGANPSPIVLDNCHENCAPADSVAKCSTDPPVSPCS